MWRTASTYPRTLRQPFIRLHVEQAGARLVGLSKARLNRVSSRPSVGFC